MKKNYFFYNLSSGPYINNGESKFSRFEIITRRIKRYN